MMAQTAKTVAKMNQLGIIHGDLAAANILTTRYLDNSCTLRVFYSESAVIVEIIDFGGSGYKATRARVFHPPISAPEIGEGMDGFLNEGVDIFAYCYVALQMLLGRAVEDVGDVDANDRPLHG
jgi:serine/threonine protein kinase